MFKNMKRLATLSLPLVALSLASCNNGPKYISYDKMRRFATEAYDQYALDTVPTTVTTNINKAKADLVIDYKTPEGGSDSLVFGFGISDIHVVVKDQYAFCLSSTLIDTIEQYYSDFAAFALTLQDQPPLQLNYELIGGNRSKVELTASENLIGSVLVRLLQMGAGALDAAFSASGYVPREDVTRELKPTAPDYLVVTGLQMLMKMLSQFIPALESPITRNDAMRYIVDVMNYAKLTISNSSKSNGEIFDTYITTDDYGLVDKFAFNFKSDFVISGLAQFKKYDSAKPKAGDRPISEAPYQFTMTGSINFDIDIVSEY